MYRVQYTPLARQDIDDILAYIANELGNKKAATIFLQQLIRSIHNLPTFPYKHKLYEPGRFNDEFRIMTVKRYNVYYVVNEETETIEIRRILYSKRDIIHLVRGK